MGAKPTVLQRKKIFFTKQTKGHIGPTRNFQEGPSIAQYSLSIFKKSSPPICFSRRNKQEGPTFAQYSLSISKFCRHSAKAPHNGLSGALAYNFCPVPSSRILSAKPSLHVTSIRPTSFKAINRYRCDSIGTLAKACNYHTQRHKNFPSK